MFTYNASTRSLERHISFQLFIVEIAAVQSLLAMMMTAIAKDNNDFYHNHSRQDTHSHVVADLVSACSHV